MEDTKVKLGINASSWLVFISITVFCLSLALSGCSKVSPLPQDDMRFAIKAGDLDKVKQLAKRNPSLINVKDYDGTAQPMIQIAVTHSRIAVLKWLLANGADVNDTDWDNRTALHCAAEVGNVAIIRILLAYGADVHAKDMEGQTPLGIALSLNHKQAAEVLHVATRKNYKR